MLACGKDYHYFRKENKKGYITIIDDVVKLHLLGFVLQQSLV